ncbi:S-layer homology domain-containing protein [Paenibacillus alba]|uniref:S-layer homology domain-containing protein n=1 Tax=Paenibacillus alba TaxID=1197127 RepID=A0ABU6GFX5_9BACL|nr:S-layer homology domain-containing protein [Paenibacillus alba]MEC0231628.1 S-layer homology domain-containing protein [Paenibacillus alba]
MRKKIKIYLPSLLTFLMIFSLCQSALGASPQSVIKYNGTSIGFNDVDDDVSGQIPVGFQFIFYGTKYDQAYANTNGFLMFKDASDECCTARDELPLNSPTNYIAPFFTDLYMSGSDVLYKTLGSAPNRKFVIQWTNMNFCCDSSSHMGTFQAILYESTNEIQMQYPTLSGSDGSYGSNALIGLQSYTSDPETDTYFNNYSQLTKSITEKQAIRFTPAGSNSYTINASANYDPIYLVNRPVSSDATLSTLELSGVELDQTISDDVYDYTASVKNEVSVTTVTYTTADSHATADLMLNGSPVSNPIDLHIGSNVINVNVMAEDGTKKSYTVTIIRAGSNNAALSSLQLSGVKLDQTVSGDVYAYTASVTNDVSVTTVTYTTVDNHATAALQLNGKLVNNPINLSVGPNIISLVVTSEDGTTRIYTITVTRAPQLVTGNDRSDSSGGSSTPAQPNPPVQPNPSDKPTTTPTQDINVFKSDIVNVVKNIEARIQQAAKNPVPAVLSDTKGHWAEKTIDTFVKLQIIDGYKDGTFNPDGKITRAEFSVLLTRVFDIQGGSHPGTAMKDVGSHWAKDAIQKLVEAGIINGYEDGTFKPENTITREEMVILLSRILNLNQVAKDTTKGNFDDLKGSYAASEITAGAQAGIVSGEADGKFHAKSNATRAEALQILLNALKLSPQLKGLLDTLN